MAQTSEPNIGASSEPNFLDLIRNQTNECSDNQKHYIGFVVTRSVSVVATICNKNCMVKLARFCSSKYQGSDGLSRFGLAVSRPIFASLGLGSEGYRSSVTSLLP